MPNPIDVKIGSQIRSLRIRMHVSEEVLADCIGVTSKQFQRFERGTSRVSISQLMQIAEVLNAPVSAFFEIPGNDNLTSLGIMTKQGLALLKAFRSIDDARLRHEAVRMIEAMAAAHSVEKSQH